MEDLDDWLLEAAGRTASGAAKQAHQPSKRRHRDSFSDDESDSKDDSDDINKYSSRKPSGSHVPLKKRSKKSDGHQQSSDEEVDPTLDHDSDESDVGSDLYKDEDDREQLAQLTELERELILSDRASKKDDKKLQKQMKSRWKADKKPEHGSRASPPSSTRGVRTSARTADKTAAKVDALNELRARRMKRDPDARNRSGDPSSVARQSRDFSPIKRRGLGISSPRSSSRSESGSESHSEDEGSVGDGSDDERFKPESDTVTLEDIKSITIRRSKLAKWHMEPFFEELIVGCLVRVGIGVRSGQNVYRLCIVHNVDSSDPNKVYQLEGRTTHKYLNCVWGSEKSAARWQMARISDAHPTQEEFEQWVREVERSSGWMPTKKEVREKKEAIEKANSFVYSAETVKQMLEVKKASSRPLNIAAEREKLRTEMERAKENDDEPEVERIKAKIQDLEELRRQSEKKNEKALKLQEMNRKNRAENFNTASGSKRVNQDLKAGEAGYDPFSRRWTRSRNYYSGKPGVAAETAPEAEPNTSHAASAVSQTEVKGSAESGVAATEAALKEAAGAGKLTDTSAPVDLGTESNTLHGFELPISLAPLQRFGGPHGAGPAFMERKQRMEAKIGCQIPEDDERKHLLTLTVGDYKRRRGLL